MADCRICLRPEQEAGPLDESICIDCERKLEAGPAPAAVARVASESRLSPLPSDGMDPMRLVQDAISRGFSGEQLREVVAVVRELVRDQAAARWAEAVTGFQAEMPPIVRSREAAIKMRSGGEFNYRYASYDNVMKAARPYLQRWAIAVSFDTQTTNDGKRMDVTVNIRVGIHTEPRKFSIPISAGQMSDAQACGAALSYAKRYALCAALNIVVTDEDNDAAAMEFIGEGDVAEIERILRKLGSAINFARFLTFAGIEPADPKTPAWSDLASIPNTELARIMDELRAREAKFDSDQKKGPRT